MREREGDGTWKWLAEYSGKGKLSVMMCQCLTLLATESF